MKQSARRKYTVTLQETEQEQLSNMLCKGIARTRVITRARILKLSSEGKTDKEICQALGVERSMTMTSGRNMLKKDCKLR